MPEFKESEKKDFVVGGEVVADSIEIATKPVLDMLESSVLKAVGLIVEQLPSMPEAEKLHVEAIMYETAALTCIGRVQQIAQSMTIAEETRKIAILESLKSRIPLLGDKCGGEIL